MFSDKIDKTLLSEITDRFDDIEFEISPDGPDHQFKFNLIFGTEDDDVISGTNGADSVFGGNGDDWLFGKEGDDVVNGGDGDDFVGGGNGDDILLGGNGNDVLNGGDGNDEMDGGEGDDVLWATSYYHNNGNDQLTGGAGADTFVFTWVSTHGETDEIMDFELGIDTLQFRSDDPSIPRAFEDLQISDVADGAMIGYGSNGILVRNVTAADLTADNFDFIF